MSFAHRSVMQCDVDCKSFSPLNKSKADFKIHSKLWFAVQGRAAFFCFGKPVSNWKCTVFKKKLQFYKTIIFFIFSHVGGCHVIEHKFNKSSAKMSVAKSDSQTFYLIHLKCFLPTPSVQFSSTFLCSLSHTAFFCRPF